MRKFVEPESVAVIGVPRQSGPGTFNSVEVMLRYGYAGKVYPINPNAGEICGLQSYASVSALPEVPDVAIISVGRERVADVVRECGDFGISRAIIITQGFSDADSAGAKMQDEIVRIAAARGMRIVGPNTIGILNNYVRFTTSFIDQPFPEKFHPVSLIAQTGVIQIAAEEFTFDYWGKAIDIGNGSDIDHVDALAYLADDPQTKVIVVHIEGMKRGKEFLELAGKVTRTKPIIALKTGRSSAGARAAISHTGSLVGEDDVANAAFRRAGIIRARTMTELKDAIHALLLLPEMQGTKLGVLTITGAGGIMALDEAELCGLEAGDVPEGLPEKLTSELPQWLQHVNNPIDIWPIGMIGGKYRESVRVALTGLLESPKIDGVLFIVPASESPLLKSLDVIPVVSEVRRQQNDKPLSVWTYLDRNAPARMEQIENTACFRTIERAVDGLAYCHRRFQGRTRRVIAQREFAVDEDRAAALLAKADSEKVLLGNDALELLSAFGIPVVKSITARTFKELEKAARETGYPAVLKISGKDFIHKTEIGGVITSIGNKAALSRAYKDLRGRAEAKAPGGDFHFILQRQAAGTEVLVGLKKDPQFGPVIACGAGGIYTEVLRDVSRELVPVDAGTVGEMLRSLKIYPLLKGTRGRKGVDLEGLGEILERASYLATRVPQISELDINPLMAAPDGCLAVDARIVFD